MTPPLDFGDQLAAQLALGRIIRMGGRPTEPGDVADYERCRAVLLTVLDPQQLANGNWYPSYARDRLRGAPGD
jgi:hypothetical protein